jgi:adenylate cyclase
VLAIFPIARDGAGGDGARDAEAAAEAAVSAAIQASDRIAVLNGSARAGGRERIGFGIGLHVGDVTYGNIGIPERLEFTVIGAAANEAARIEAMTKELGVSVVMSAEFARLYSGAVKPLGAHALRGVGHKMEVFTLAD